MSMFFGESSKCTKALGTLQISLKLCPEKMRYSRYSTLGTNILFPSIEIMHVA